jgi:hypothetical protein
VKRGQGQPIGPTLTLSPERKKNNAITSSVVQGFATMGSSPALWRSVISPNLKHLRILQSAHRSQFAVTLVPRGLLALDRNRPS